MGPMSKTSILPSQNIAFGDKLGSSHEGRPCAVPALFFCFLQSADKHLLIGRSAGTYIKIVIVSLITRICPGYQRRTAVFSLLLIDTAGEMDGAYFQSNARLLKNTGIGDSLIRQMIVGERSLIPASFPAYMQNGLFSKSWAYASEDTLKPSKAYRRDSCHTTFPNPKSVRPNRPENASQHIRYTLHPDYKAVPVPRVHTAESAPRPVSAPETDQGPLPVLLPDKWLQQAVHTGMRGDRGGEDAAGITWDTR